MLRHAAVIAALLATSSTAYAQAQEEAPRPEGPRDHGVRLGLDLAVGRHTGGSPGRLNDAQPTLIPLGIDLGYRVASSVVVGIHGFFALAARNDCFGSDVCGAHDLGIGAHVEVAPWRRGSVSPWLRYGFGYEILSRHTGSGMGEVDAYRKAFDLLDLRAGADFVLARQSEGRVFAVGPYVGLLGGKGLGTTKTQQFFSETVEATEDQPNWHLWFMAGVRATYDP